MKRVDHLMAKLGIQTPIIQAPMAGVSTPALTAAASNSGALGSFGAGASTPSEMLALIKATRDLTDKPFNVNVFCHPVAKPDPAREAEWLQFLEPIFERLGAVPPKSLRLPYKSFIEDEEALEVLLRETPRVVSFHFGLPPKSWIERLQAAGIVTISSATSLKEGQTAEEIGVDAVVGQGIEAGGHRGTFDANVDSGLGVFALTRILATHLRIPVIAAGGIMDGSGIDAALRLGACAAQLGTAFILCPESAANADFRAHLSSEDVLTTAITAVISGRPARGLVNRFHREVDIELAPRLPDYPIAYDAGKLLVAAASKAGEKGFAVQWAGQGAPLARSLPASQLIDTLMVELAIAQRE